MRKATETIVNAWLKVVDMSEPSIHEDIHDVREHGRDWIVCNACGAQWADYGSTVEIVTEGDGSCEDNALQNEIDKKRKPC